MSLIPAVSEPTISATATRLDLYVFGANDEGQLGNGRVCEKELLPNRVDHSNSITGLENCTILSGAKHTILLNSTHEIFVTGDNTCQQIGYVNHENDICTSPALRVSGFVPRYNGVSLCAATWTSSAYIHNDCDQANSELKKLETQKSFIYTEGLGSFGELGRDSTTSTAGLSIPEQKTHQFDPIQPLRFQFPCEVKDLQAGYSHYVALLADGTVWGWGSNTKLQLGNTLPPRISIPTKLDIPFTGACAVTCGKEFTYIVGDPLSGQHAVLGKDKYGIQSKKLGDVRSWTTIHATWHAIYVLFDDGTLAAWGKGNNFQLIPPDLPKIRQFAAGSDHVLALTRDNKMLAWGNAEHGNCGDVTKMPVLGPGKYLTGTWFEMTEIPGRAVSVHAGNATSFVVTEVEVEGEPTGEGETPENS